MYITHGTSSHKSLITVYYTKPEKKVEYKGVSEDLEFCALDHLTKQFFILTLFPVEASSSPVDTPICHVQDLEMFVRIRF